MAYRNYHWFHGDMLVWCWVALILYLGALIACPIVLDARHNDMSLPLFVCLVMFLAQMVFLLSGDVTHLRRPIRSRVFFPALMSFFLINLLIVGAILCILDYASALVPPQNQAPGVLLLLLFPGAWAGYGLADHYWVRRQNRLKALTRLSAILVIAAGIELIQAIATLIQMNQFIATHATPGGFSLAGLGSSLGLLIGMAVLLLAMGSLVVLLFLRRRYRLAPDENERDPVENERYCTRCGYDLGGARMPRGASCPVCGEQVLYS